MLWEISVTWVLYGAINVSGCNVLNMIPQRGLWVGLARNQGVKDCSQGCYKKRKRKRKIVAKESSKSALLGMSLMPVLQYCSHGVIFNCVGWCLEDEPFPQLWISAREAYTVILFAILWSMWKERNERIFKASRSYKYALRSAVLLRIKNRPW